MPATKRRSKRSASTRKKTATPSLTVEKNNSSSAEKDIQLKRKKSWRTRVFWSWVMTLYALSMFYFTRQAGCMVTLFVIQSVCYFEIIQLLSDSKKEAKIPFFRNFYVYWFAVFTFWSWGRVLKPHLMRDSFVGSLGFSMYDWLKHFEIISYILYIAGILAFVLSLEDRTLFKYQFQQFAYSHCALLLIVVQGTFNVANLFNGIIWVLFPMSLIVCNDCFAYIFGFLFGKTPLIKLSPKKTWEGFLGGLLATMIHAVLFSRVLSDPAFDPFYQSGLVPIPYIQPVMTCKPRGVFIESFSLHPPTCEWAQLYKPVAVCGESFPVANQVAKFFGLENFVCEYVSWSPVQFHALVFGLFASVIAPFAGFFASGFKRAIKAKDFGNLFPGHGGMLDRFDCHMLMASFCFFYYSYVIEGSNPATKAQKALNTLSELGLSAIDIDSIREKLNLNL